MRHEFRRGSTHCPTNHEELVSYPSLQGGHCRAPVSSTNSPAAMAATIPASASLSVGRFPNNRASSSSCPCPATALPRTFFLGFSKFPAAVAKPSLGVASLPSRRYLRTHCQQQEQQQRLVVVPREQRWMFEESEINGPVLSLSLSLTTPILILPISRK